MASAVAPSERAGGDRVYFNRPGVALVTWNPDLKAVCLESSGLHTSEAQAVLDAIIRALRAHHGSRWLLDGRKMRVVKQADQDWIAKNWLPRAAAAGLKLAAIVQPTIFVPSPEQKFCHSRCQRILTSRFQTRKPYQAVTSIQVNDSSFDEIWID